MKNRNLLLQNCHIQILLDPIVVETASSRGLQSLFIFARETPWIVTLHSLAIFAKETPFIASPSSPEKHRGTL
jgi:hypothetical protein